MPRHDHPGGDTPGDETTRDDMTRDEIDPAVIERVSRVASEMGDADFALQDPPPELWARIATAVDADQRASADGDLQGAGVTDGADADRATPAGADPDGPTPVVSLDQRRRRMNRSIVVAVAASVFLLVITGVLLTRGGSSPDPELVATATLEPVEGPGGVEGVEATADARLVSDGDARRLVLSARDMTAAPAEHHYELWLLDPDTGEPLSLGAMSGSVSVPVPADVDLDAFEVVDVSIQADGQVEHSGESVLRGTLA